MRVMYYDVIMLIVPALFVSAFIVSVLSTVSLRRSFAAVSIISCILIFHSFVKFSIAISEDKNVLPDTETKNN